MPEPGMIRARMVARPLAAMACTLVLSVAAPAAIANPEVRLEWVMKDGVSIAPSSSVVVTAADIAMQTELVLEISLVLDGVAIHEFGFEVIFDEDLRDELEFPLGAIPARPAAYDGPFEAIGFFDAFESDGQSGGFGSIGPYRGCVVGSVCDLDPETFGGTPIGNRTIVIDRVTFLPTATASNDRRDVVIQEIPFNEEFRDADGAVIPHADIAFGHASIVPEPTSSLLGASALVTLALLARVRSRPSA